MMRKLLHASLIILAPVLSAVTLRAQPYYNQTSQYLKYNSVWTFYNNARLNLGNNVVSQSSLYGAQAEGCASVSDPATGALLFYSDGGKCYNSSNTVMPNGNGLLGNSTGGYSSAQGVCIVPVPGQAKKYYLFSLETADMLPDATSLKLYYSVVDMNLNGGQGDVVAAGKNTVLDGGSMLSEAMLAIQGDNCDVWLMLHTRKDPVFKAYHITAAGIDPTPVLSTAGGQIQGTTTVGMGGFIMEEDAYGQATMTVSPDRNKLAISCEHIGSSGVIPVTASTGRSWGGLLCDFDAATGVVSNAILTDTSGQYTAAFSPDNSKLYYTSIIPNTLTSQVNQVTITSNDSAIIAGSKTLIQSPLGGSIQISIRAYNDTVYIINPNLLCLDRINSPNLAGTACGYQSNAISFPATTFIGTSLPNEVVYAAGPDTVRSRVLDTLICSSWGNGVMLRPVNQSLDDAYTWSNATTDSTLPVMVPGTYWVKYGNSCHYRVDTFIVKGSDLDPVITVNLFDLSTTQPYSSYQWYRNDVLIPGASNGTYTVTQNGAYTVVVSDGTCTDTAAVYNVTNVTGIDEVQRLASQIKIFPNPAKDIVNIQAPLAVDVQLTGIEGRVLKTGRNARQISMAGMAPGIYLLRITDKDGIVLKVEKLIREQ